MWRWCAPATGKRGFRPRSSRSSTTWAADSDDADLIVCRAGATTLAEITAAGSAAVLIPLPTATDDHQRKNAEALADAGAAEMLLQHDLTGHALAERIRALAADPARRGAYRRGGAIAGEAGRRARHRRSRDGVGHEARR